MLSRRSHPRRGGGTAVVTALLLTPLLLMVAFAVDLCNVWRTDSELQAAADAAALAGASELLVPGQALQPLNAVNQVVAGLPVVGNTASDLLKQTAGNNAV